MDIKAFDKMNYGLYIVSTKSGDQTAGCVVNTLTQATVQPARLLVTIHKDNQTERLIEESGVFCRSGSCTICPDGADWGLWIPVQPGFGQICQLGAYGG